MPLFIVLKSTICMIQQSRSESNRTARHRKKEKEGKGGRTRDREWVERRKTA